ncbi:MAG: hypothetical protein RLZZ437_2566, partial [Pseudomonadota bacterium]
PCVVVGPRDVVFHAGRGCALAMRRGERLSLFPFGPVRGQSRGLEWPIGGLDFAPDGRIGTSNRVAGPEVELVFDGPGMLVIVPKRHLPGAIAAVQRGRAGRA